MADAPKFEFEDEQPEKPKERSAAEVMARLGVGNAPAAPAPGATPAPAKPVPAATPAKTAKPTPVAAPPPPPLPGSEDTTVPGARKDLWKCPHCGAGNKPDRTTCRACGKSSTDAVVVPWNRNPLVLAVIAVVVVALVAGAFIARRTDLTLKPADAHHVDGKVRQGGSAEGTTDLPNGFSFEARGRAAVTGLIIAVKPIAGGASVALALRGIDPPGDGSVPDTATWVHVVAEKPLPKLVPGAWLSLAGMSGSITLDGRIAKGTDTGVSILVAEDGIRVSE